jgi:hypothetical protein
VYNLLLLFFVDKVIEKYNLTFESQYQLIFYDLEGMGSQKRSGWIQNQHISQPMDR